MNLRPTIAGGQQAARLASKASLKLAYIFISGTAIRVERAYGLMTAQYGEMTASFIRVLNLQRMLYQNETGYIDALEHVWTSSIALSGFLLEGGLMAPASTELDMPMDGTERMESMDQTSRLFDRTSDFP